MSQSIAQRWVTLLKNEIGKIIIPWEQISHFDIREHCNSSGKITFFNKNTKNSPSNVLYEIFSFEDHRKCSVCGWNFPHKPFPIGRYFFCTSCFNTCMNRINPDYHAFTIEKYYSPNNKGHGKLALDPQMLELRKVFDKILIIDELIEDSQDNLVQKRNLYKQKAGLLFHFGEFSLSLESLSLSECLYSPSERKTFDFANLTYEKAAILYRLKEFHPAIEHIRSAKNYFQTNHIQSFEEIYLCKYLEVLILMEIEDYLIALPIIEELAESHKNKPDSFESVDLELKKISCILFSEPMIVMSSKVSEIYDLIQKKIYTCPDKERVEWKFLKKNCIQLKRKILENNNKR